MNFESKKALITFNNQPKLPEHEIEKDQNIKRVKLVEEIESFISTHERFKNQDTKVTFSENGVSSLVSIIETPVEKLVLKIPLTSRNTGEAKFLTVWENAGVTVPHIVEEGLIGDESYILMEYIDAETLRESRTYEEMVGQEIFIDMGRTLHTMHTVETNGYGHVFDGKPEFTEFKDWLESEHLSKIIKYIQENNILGEDHGHLSVALETLLSHTKIHNKSSYCHNDFSAYNTFDTKPLTVFDPSPTFNNGYLDLGRSIVIAVAHGGLPKAGEQLVNGYFKDEPINKKALQSSILLNSYTKIAHWHKINKIKNIERVQQYLLQTKHLLE